LVEETGLPRENHRPVASHWQTLSHNVVSSTLHHEQDSHSQQSCDGEVKEEWQYISSSLEIHRNNSKTLTITLIEQ
jgi:hypothetical protein